MSDGNWTLTVLIGAPVFALVILGLVALGIFLIWIGEWVPASVIVAPLLILTVIVGLLMFMPFQKEYLYWAPVAGEVEEIDQRLIGTGSGMAERFVFTIDGTPYGVDDTRAATVDEGDHVSLMCKKEWQWQAADGWGCGWGGDAQAATFTVTDEERGLFNMHPELVKEQNDG